MTKKKNGRAEEARFKKRHGAYTKRGAHAAQKADHAQYDALVETMVIAACIDGILAPGEAETLAEQIRQTPGFERLDNQGLANAVARVSKQIEADGIVARVKSIARSIGDDDRLREEAFTLATLFVHFDGEVGDEEQSFLNVLQKELKISDERASHIDALFTELSPAPEE